MIKSLEVNLEFTEVVAERNYKNVSALATLLGDSVGIEKFGEEQWHSMCYPAEEKMRIWAPPKFSDGKLSIAVTPYGWDDLQRHKQIHSIGTFDDSDPLKYMIHAIALTANGLVESADGKLIFHRKKDGAKEGTIHTFGGYVTREDVKSGGISQAIARELGEKDELGLRHDEMEVTQLFGTQNGLPSTLWGFGTAAVYGIVRTNLTFLEMQERINTLPARESLAKKIYGIEIEKIADLEKNFDVHPQTRQVIDVMREIYLR